MNPSRHGSRTRRLAVKGFSYSLPPFQGLRLAQVNVLQVLQVLHFLHFLHFLQALVVSRVLPRVLLTMDLAARRPGRDRGRWRSPGLRLPRSHGADERDPRARVAERPASAAQPGNPGRGRRRRGDRKRAVRSRKASRPPSRHGTGGEFDGLSGRNSGDNGPWAGSGRPACGVMQVRHATQLTATEYVERQAWLDVEPPECPFHPGGDCQSWSDTAPMNGTRPRPCA